MTHHRLGKGLAASGKVLRVSSCALLVHTKSVIPAITVAMTAVLAFQLPGCEYQPPVGDQTCLGYLGGVSKRRAGRAQTHGTLPPPPCSCQQR